MCFDILLYTPTPTPTPFLKEREVVELYEDRTTDWRLNSTCRVFSLSVSSFDGRMTQVLYQENNNDTQA